MYVLIITINALFITTVIVMRAIMVIQKRKNKKREKAMLQDIESSIATQLHAAYPSSKWRWICRPTSFASSGGIARIEVLGCDGNQRFIDVCLSANNYMALHISYVAELDDKSKGEYCSDVTFKADSYTKYDSTSSSNSMLNAKNESIPTTVIKPYDKESVLTWYNIVLINSLTELIDNLHAKDDVCLHISQDGKAYVEDNSGVNIVYDFGEMPEIDLWSCITDKLNEEGLFAEVREESCIFISWV